MDKKCGNCEHWNQTSELKHYDGGFPGKCGAKFPLWVVYLWGPRRIDTLMRSTQIAVECELFTKRTGDTNAS